MEKIKNFLSKYLRDIWFQVSASTIFPIFTRSLLWRVGGIHVEGKSYIGAGWHVVGKNLSISKDCVFGYSGYIDASGKVDIGERVHIGPATKILSATHTIQHEKYRRDPKEVLLLHTKIGDGCWIGTGAIILPGVHIGDGCVIGAGSIVARDCQPNGLYIGQPARRIKDLPISKSMASPPLQS